MIGVLILTHGSLAKELLAAARTIAPSSEVQEFEALALEWNDSFDLALAKVHEKLPSVDHGDGVLILTDIYGGTPSNVALSFCSHRAVEVVSGVNLPMVVRLGCLMKKDMALGEVAAWIRDKGRQSIVFCGDQELAASKRYPTRRIRDQS